MDTEHERKFTAMFALWRTLTPSGLTQHRLVWQMDTEMVVALAKETERFISNATTIKFHDGIHPSSGIECLGIPVEIILTDEVNLVIKVA